MRHFSFIQAGLASVLCLSLVSCRTNTAEHEVHDGTYTGTGKGYNGDITVQVKFSDHRISAITVTSESETRTVSDSAIKKVPQYIQSNNSLNVDVSTGATLTSKGIISAVSDAIKQAGGNPDEWQDDATGKHKDTEKEIYSDAVVIGGGCAGLAAVLRLEQNGIDTTLIEKSDSLGGSLLYSSGMSQLVADSEKTNDEEDSGESAEDAVNDVWNYGDKTGDKDLLNLISENLDDTVTWQVKDLGISFDEDWKESDAYKGNALKEYNESVGELLSREADVCGARILTNTAAIDLVYDDGQVSGVKAKASDGTVYTVDCSYVVIASGSENMDEALPYYGPLDNEGDLLTVGKQYQFTETDKENSLTYATGVRVADQKAVDVMDADEKAVNKGLFIVNQDGNRFVCEEENRQDISDAVSSQKQAYLVMSDSAYKSWKEELLNNPVLEDEDIELIEDDEIPSVIHGKDMEEACSLAGLDEEAVLASEESLQVPAEAGGNVDVYGRRMTSVSINPDKDIWIVPLCTYVYGNSGGIETDEELHVLYNTDHSLDNVYVIGSAVGNVTGNKSIEGLGTAWAFVSGKTAADHITDQIQKVTE